MKIVDKISQIGVRHFVWLMAVLAMLMVSSGVIFYWLETERTKNLVIDRFQQVEITLARSGSMAISEFFHDKQEQLLFISRILSKNSDDAYQQQVVNGLAETLKAEGSLVDVVARADREGLVVWGTRVTTGETFDPLKKVNVADRDYFIWAKSQTEQTKVFFSEPLLARGGMTEGEWNVVMAAPVYKQGFFNGLVFVTFPVKSLTEKFVLPMVTLSEAGVVIVNQENQVISSNYQQLFGENVFEVVKRYNLDTSAEIFSAFKKAASGDEGSLVHQAPSFDSQGKMSVISAYAPVDFDQTNWFLWISFPVEKAMADTLPLMNLKTWTLILNITGLLLLSLSVIVGFRLVQKKAFIDGFHKARKELIKSIKGN